MNFLLSDERLMLMDSVRRLLSSACDVQQVHKIVDRDAGFDADLWQKLVAAGVPAVMLPETHDGLGLGMIDLALIAELLGEFAAPVPFLGQVLAGLAIDLCGTEGQKKRWLARLASGELLGTVAFGEGEGRWLPAEWRVALAGGVTGVKHFVPHAEDAQLLVVGTADGLVVVEKGDGVSVRRSEAVDRTRPIASVTFDQAPYEKLEGDARGLTRVIDAAAILLAADAFGGASRCVTLAADYAKLREQFGVVIGTFQGLKHQLANMALMVEPGRGLYWYAAHAWDALPDKASHAAAQAKARLSDNYLQSARDMVEVFGGIGFTWEHEAHLYLKRAMFDWTWLGQPARHYQRAADLAGW